MLMYVEPDCKARRCPKCRKYPDNIIEHYNHTIHFDVSDNGIIEIDSGEANTGLPFEVWGECSCGHKWKLRGIEQIDDLEVD